MRRKNPAAPSPLKKTSVLAGLLVGLAAVLAAASLWGLLETAISRPTPADLDSESSILDPLSWGVWEWSIALLATLTPVYLARVHRNAEALSGSHVKGSPAWTAGIWFVPVVGGLLAAGALRQI